MQTLPNPEVRLKVKGSMLFKVNYRHIDSSFSKLSVNNRGTNMHTYIYIYIGSLQVDFRVEQCSVR